MKILAKIDWLDKLSIVAIAVLTLIAVSMLANAEISSRAVHNNIGAEQKENLYAKQKELNKKLYKEVTDSMSLGKYSEAAVKLKEIVESHPDKSLSYIYLAKLFVKQGKLGDAIHEYRRAVEMDSDYVDRKTPHFVGDEIETYVQEAREKFGREKELKPKDKEVRKVLEDVYYLQRRLAGGCE